MKPPEYHGMSGKAAINSLEVFLMCGNNGIGFCGGNIWWIIILVLLFCCCGNQGMGCGCDNNGCGGCC